MAEYKEQKKKTVLQKLKKWKNLSYVLMGVAVIIMICIAAANYQSGFRSGTIPKYHSLNQASGILFGCPTLKRGVLLSFDDGPMSDAEDVLDILKSNNVSSLFFFSPEKLQRYPQIAQKITRDGHELGLSIRDEDGSINSADIFGKKIKAAELAMINATDVTPRFLRPSNITFDHYHLKTASSLGYTTVMWNAATHENYHENDEPHSPILWPRQGAILSIPEISKDTNYWLQNVLFSQKFQAFISPKECFGFK